MDGYAAYGRVDRRRAGAGGSSSPAREDWSSPDPEVIEAADGAAETSPLGRWLRERLVTAREQWAIATFYLFDSNSWR